MQNEECTCESCKKRADLEKRYPNKEIGMQYAYWKLSEDVFLPISADEFDFLDGKTNNTPLLVSFDKEKPIFYYVAYGVFVSQTNWYSEFYDLALSKNETYFYTDHDKKNVFEVKIKDFYTLSKKENSAKVSIMFESNNEIVFPSGNDELAVTLSRLMPGLGDKLSDLIFSRIEFGFFRLDKGTLIPSQIFKKNIEVVTDKSVFLGIGYNRFLIMDS